MNLIRKNIPNAITSINIFSGICGIAAASLGRLDIAFCLMITGAVADFFDGFSARLLGSFSPMGKELDSLADMTTFGALPAFMLFTLMRTKFCISCFFVWIPLLIVVFSGLRLAKFNIDERQTTGFIGMPTPACAMICGSLAANAALRPESWGAEIAFTCWFIPALSVILCFLLVCELPMFSMKIHKGEKRGKVFYMRIAFGIGCVGALVAVIVAGWHWTMAVFIAFIWYILVNVAGAFIKDNSAETKA